MKKHSEEQPFESDIKLIKHPPNIITARVGFNALGWREVNFLNTNIFYERTSGSKEILFPFPYYMLHVATSYMCILYINCIFLV